MHIAGKKIVNVASLLIFLFTCKEAMAFLTPFSLFRPVTAADVVKSGATLASQVVHHPGWCYRLNIGRLFCCWNKQIINVFMFLSKIIVKQTTYLHQTIRKAAARWNLQVIFFSKWMHFNTSISIFFFFRNTHLPKSIFKEFLVHSSPRNMKGEGEDKKALTLEDEKNLLHCRLFIWW